MSKTILVPIDVSDSELTQRVITHVENESKIDNAQMHFLTVVPSLSYFSSLGQAYTAGLPDTEEMKIRAKKRLEDFVSQFSIPAERVHIHVVQGSPKDRILEMAKTLPADMVIIASHRPDITTYLLGSTAAAVVRHAECAVLVVR